MSAIEEIHKAIKHTISGALTASRKKLYKGIKVILKEFLLPEIRKIVREELEYIGGVSDRKKVMHDDREDTPDFSGYATNEGMGHRGQVDLFSDPEHTIFEDERGNRIDARRIANTPAGRKALNAMNKDYSAFVD